MYLNILHPKPNSFKISTNNEGEKMANCGDTGDTGSVISKSNDSRTTLIWVGLAIAAAGFTGKSLLPRAPMISKKMNQLLKLMQSADSNFFANNKYYKGGFEAKMTKQEAGLILGVSPYAPKNKIKEARNRLMMLNHPDKGGSKYIATKIGDATDLLIN